MVVHVQNDGQAGDPDEPGGEGWELVFPPDDDEIVVRKSEPNAFAPDPQLARTLQAEGVDRIVLAGMQSEFCVRETSLGALHAGFGVSLPKGAHATYGATASDAAALSASVEKGLEDEGVRVVDLSAVEF
jgi:nicotinamidase-related amidase